MYGLLRRISNISLSLKAGCCKLWNCRNGSNYFIKNYTQNVAISAGCGFYVTYTSDHIKVHSIDSSIFSTSFNLSLPSGKKVASVNCGRSHMVLLTTDGSVYSCGLKSLGQCGGDNSSNLADSNNGWSIITTDMCQVAVGLDHNLFLTKSGRIYACGWSGDGQTGIGIDEQPIVWDPLPVDGEINHHNVTSIYTGGDSSFAMTDENLIYAWGNNEYGQLTFTSNITQITTPTLIDTSFLDAPVKNICVGGSFTLFLTESGHVYTTGYSLVNNIHKFHLLTSNVKAVQCGLHYCITFSTDNVYTVWGTCPEKIRHFTSRGITQVACGLDAIYKINL